MPSSVVADNERIGPAEFAAQVWEQVSSGSSLRVEVGESICDVDGQVAEVILQVLGILGSGQSLELQPLPETISTGQAADLLGVSRPTVVKLIDEEKLPAIRVGTHRRLKTSDVLAYRMETAASRAKAMDELVRLSAELVLYDQ